MRHLRSQPPCFGERGVLEPDFLLQRPGLPVRGQLQAVERKDNGKHLTPGEIVATLWQDVRAQSVNHAIDEKVERFAHATASSARSNARTIDAIWVAMTAIRISLNRSTSKARTAHI